MLLKIVSREVVEQKSYPIFVEIIDPPFGMMMVNLRKNLAVLVNQVNNQAHFSYLERTFY